MFVRYFAELAMTFEAVERCLLDSPDGRIPRILEDAEGRGTALLAEVGFTLIGERRLDKRVEVRVGDPYRIPGRTVLPIEWTAAGGSHLFPSLEADLEVASLGPRRTQLSISARYTPPLDGVGRVLDRAILHRVAEATVKDFLDRVAGGIGGAADAQRAEQGDSATVRISDG